MVERNSRKVRMGTVVSNKMDKTVVVAVQRQFKHPLYGKMVRKIVKFKAHDEKNQCLEGDVIRIMETRPLSKSKRWRVLEVLERAEKI